MYSPVMGDVLDVELGSIIEVRVPSFKGIVSDFNIKEYLLTDFREICSVYVKKKKMNTFCSRDFFCFRDSFGENLGRSISPNF